MENIKPRDGTTWRDREREKIAASTASAMNAKTLQNIENQNIYRAKPPRTETDEPPELVTSAASNSASACPARRLNGLQETVSRLSAIFENVMDSLESQIKTLKSELGASQSDDQADAEVIDVAQASDDINSMSIDIFHQPSKDKEIYVLSDMLFTRGLAGLNVDLAEIRSENLALKTTVEKLTQAYLTLRAHNSERLKESQEKVQMHKEHIEEQAKELRLLKGVERRFIAALDEVAKKDKMIGILEIGANANREEIGKLRSLHGNSERRLSRQATNERELGKRNAQLAEEIKKMKLELVALSEHNVGDVVDKKEDNAFLKSSVEIWSGCTHPIPVESATNEIKIDSSKSSTESDEMQQLTIKIQELERDMKLKEPLTMIGASIRMAYLRYGQTKEPENVMIHDKIVTTIARSKNCPADAAIYQTGILSVDTEGHLFQHSYGSPVFVQLDYSVMPKFCEMLEHLVIVPDSLPETHCTRGMPEWARRKELVGQLKGIWNKVITKDVMDFERREDVGNFVDELAVLSDCLEGLEE